MSIASSASSSTPSTLSPESTSIQRYSFVQHSDNVIASSTRRAVRSHAMRAVRRLQRQESANSSHLKWRRDHSRGESVQRMRPDGQSAGFDEQHETPQFEEPVQAHRQEGETIGGTLYPRFLESPNVAHVDSQSSIGPSSEGAGSLYFTQRQESQPDTSMEVDEETTATFDHPKTPLGAGRLDPFQTSSIHINRSFAELIDHCVLPSSHSYKAPGPLQVHSLVPLTSHRPDYYAGNVLWRTMSQANSS